MMSSSEWYVRIAGEAIGPISSDELRELGASGGIQPATSVSADGVSWKPASQVKGLTISTRPFPRPQQPPPFRSAPVGRPTVQTPATQYSAAWIIAGVLAGIFGLIAIAFIGLVLIGANDHFVQQDQVRKRTLEYWNQVAAAMQHVLQGGPDNIVTAANRAANEIAQLPTVEVDQEAVQCGTDVAALLRNIAAYCQKVNDPGTVVEAFLRGMAGDPFGTTTELYEDANTVKRQSSAVQQECINARASLTNRYGVEFPSLPW